MSERGSASVRRTLLALRRQKKNPTTRFYFLPERVRLHPSARAVKVIESDSKTGGGGIVGFLLPKGSEIDGNPDRFGIVSDF